MTGNRTITAQIEVEIYEQLKGTSHQMMLPMAETIRRAIVEWLGKQDEKKEKKS